MTRTTSDTEMNRQLFINIILTNNKQNIFQLHYFENEHQT